MDLFKTPAIAIIGTAGRKDDAKRLLADSFDRMSESAQATLQEWGVKRAISGGAAWADHLAVKAYLDGALDSLCLHFPARFADGRFQGMGDGQVANYYHEKFSAVRGVDTFAELTAAIARGAEVIVGNGFKSRNLAVGRDSTHMLAFTFGGGRSLSFDSVTGDPGYRNAASAGLKDGGTAHCWTAAKGPSIKRHVDLGLLLGPQPVLAM